VVRYDGTGAADVVEFPGLGAVIPIERYRAEIAACARTAREPFDGIDKVFADEFDREQYASFWDEYERLLARAGS
jgi:hypothetical protein